MADKTKIEWAEATLQYANGCSLASPGCTNCYAMKQAHRFPVRQGLTVPSKGGMVWTGEVRMNDKALQQAIAWKRGRKIFWNAHGDLFHPNVTDAEIDRQFAACAMTSQHTHMILTKRSTRMREYMDAITAHQGAHAVANEMIDLGATTAQVDAFIDRIAEHSFLPNVWMGVSVEDQERAEERIPDLLATPAAVRFISAEPLLGPVDLTRIVLPRRYQSIEHGSAAISWVISGGESGPKARPANPQWFRDLRDQCVAAGVPYLHKQNGEWVSVSEVEGFEGNQIHEFPDGRWVRRVGKKLAGRTIDGVEWTQFPA